MKPKKKKKKFLYVKLSPIIPLSASLYYTVFHETAANIHYSPRLRCFRETFASRIVTYDH